MEINVHKKISDLYRSLNLPVTQEIDFTIHFLSEIYTHIPFKLLVFRVKNKLADYEYWSNKIFICRNL